MRFANRLQFGAKTHEVSMTALRIVQRMKKDSIHSGRRPTGLCGAALLIAARMHDYNRTINDVVGIVKIHESTLRKRLTEFAETPSSALTFDEFMSVDLEAEQDPPAFKAARIKDKERLMQLGELELSSLQRQIDDELEIQVKKLTPKRYLKGMSKDDFEETEASAFIAESNMEAIGECLDESVELSVRPKIEGLKPDLASMCTPSASELRSLSSENKLTEGSDNQLDGEELNLEDLDDEEIDGYIMTEQEAKYKNEMWMKLNAEYLKETKLKEERLAKEREEGKVGKKKRKPKKKQIGPSQTAGEAIEKMLQEKKISSKINYDILKTLTEPRTDEIIIEDDLKPDTKSDIKPAAYTVGRPPAKKPKLEFGLPIGSGEAEVDTKDGILMKSEPIVENGDEDDDFEEAEPEPEPEPEHSSLMDMLNNGDGDDDYYGYEDEHY
ncbi:BRF1.2 family protein [Megaselia abdita]